MVVAHANVKGNCKRVTSEPLLPLQRTLLHIETVAQHQFWIRTVIWVVSITTALVVHINSLLASRTMVSGQLDCQLGFSSGYMYETALKLLATS